MYITLLKRIRVSILVLDLEEDIACSYDNLTIVDGGTEHKFCGALDDVPNDHRSIESTGIRPVPSIHQTRAEKCCGEMVDRCGFTSSTMLLQGRKFDSDPLTVIEELLPCVCVFWVFFHAPVHVTWHN